MKSLNKPLFSVVIPLYNKRAHIERTLESVLSQSLEDFDVIVVDDGSTDGSAELLRERYPEQIANGLIKVVPQANAGVSSARNTGVGEATGTVIAFIDADDTWEPHFLDEIASLRQRFPAARAYGTGYQYIVNEGGYVDPKVRFSKPTHNPRLLTDYFEIGARGALPFTMSSFCIEKGLFEELGGFPTGEAMGEDQDLFCKTAIATSIAYSPSVLSFYHHDAENRACERLVPDSECPFSRRLKKHAESSFEPRSLVASMLDYTAAHLLHIVSLNVKSRRMEAARRILSDERCKRHYVRYLWWKARCALAEFA